MDWIWDYAKAQGPLVVLLTLNIWGLLSGRVITLGHHRDVIHEKDEAIRKGDLREAEQRRIATGLTDVLTEVSPIVRKAIREEPRPK